VSSPEEINALFRSQKPVAKSLVQELSHELDDILVFWNSKMPDEMHGGFFGAMSHEGLINDEAPKGVVLHARILWTFSAAALLKKDEALVTAAKRAYEYLVDRFVDETYGGVYWSITYDGKPLETKKQVYAQSFCIYALAAYFELTAFAPALELAHKLYNLVEQHSRDEKMGGYFEAFSRSWGAIGDLRLSTKDANEKKTMNTHLHVLEAYTQLYRVSPNEKLAKNIESLLEIFTTKIIDNTTATQGLFFDENWVRKDSLVSFGHDIESSWLLQEAAEALHSQQWIAATRNLSVRMAQSATRGVDSDGGMWHEYDAGNNHWQYEKHWWPQAEALVGFCNAWQNSGNEIYLQYMLNSWEFLKKYIINKTLGEWRWGVYKDYQVMDKEDFAGIWKCPYHNGRACIELIRRLSD
jgi:mannobiose 2-epimerase